MKLAISNIAWDQHDDPATLTALRDLGVAGIEVAPTKVWPGWEGATEASAADYKQTLADLGFEIPAMQAILFGKPEFQVFDAATHASFLEHMKLVADIAAGFGAKTLVFGSPKNRRRGQLAYADAMKVAADFFAKAAAICDAKDCYVGLEHNPVEYACDFVTNVADARALVDLVDHPGFKLHLDSAGIHLCGGEISDVISQAGEFVHYHVSEPMLEPIAGGCVDHAAGLRALDTLGYQHWVSIEMKTPSEASLVTESVKVLLNSMP